MCVCVFTCVYECVHMVRGEEDCHVGDVPTVRTAHDPILSPLGDEMLFFSLPILDPPPNGSCFQLQKHWPHWPMGVISVVSRF